MASSSKSYGGCEGYHEEEEAAVDGLTAWQVILCPTSTRAAIAGIRDGKAASSPPRVGGGAQKQAAVDEGEEDRILMIKQAFFFRSSGLRTFLYWLCVVATLGLLHLLLSWFPLAMARLRYSAVSGKDSLSAEFVVIEGQDKVWSFVPIYAVSRRDGDITEPTPLSEASSFRPDWWWWCCWSLVADVDPGEGTALLTTQKHEVVIHMLEWRRETFWYDDDKNGWYRLRFDCQPTNDLHKLAIDCLDMSARPASKSARIRSYGPNRINIPVESYFKLAVDQVATPFFAFQIFSFVVWFIQGFYLYTIVLIAISIAAVVEGISFTRKNQTLLRRIASYESRVEVVRLDHQEGVSGSGAMAIIMEDACSSTLMPGDVIKLAPGMSCPGDMVLLAGSAVMSESMLTGESAPVPKEALPLQFHTTATLSTKIPAKHMLFCGTQVMQTRPAGRAPFEATDRPDQSIGVKQSLWDLDEEKVGGVVLAMVLRTGFHTEKGKLVRGMLFPQVRSQHSHKRESDVLLYIALLSVVMLVAVTGYAVYAVHLGYGTEDVVIRCLAGCTVLIPPVLPLALAVGTSLAAVELAKRRIFTTSPGHIASAGHVDTVCYDKTGTLTLSNDHVAGVVPSRGAATTILRSAQELVMKEPRDEGLIEVLMACQSVTTVPQGEGGGGGVMLVGDPLEVEMIKFSGARLSSRPVAGEEGAGGGGGALTAEEERAWQHPHVPALADTLIFPREDQHGVSRDKLPVLATIRRLDFNFESRMMSVVVQALSPETEGVGEPSPLMLVSKGAPEALKACCSNLPSDFDRRLFDLSSAGWRVLACAYRPLGSMSVEGAMRASRPELESNLTFCGFLLIGNELKPATVRVLQSIKAAGVRQAMVTGDNALTALAVAKVCGDGVFVRKGLPGYILDATAGGELTVTCVETGKQHGSDILAGDRMKAGEVTVVVTGAAFSALPSAEDVGEGVEEGGAAITKEQVLGHARVFARFNPREKQGLVKGLQDMGRSVCMAGDGANDSFALKEADAGISICSHIQVLTAKSAQAEIKSAENAEAAVPSIAAHFSTPLEDISAVLILLCEGRGSLATSMVVLRYMLAYGVIEFTAALLVYIHDLDLTDTMYLWADLFNVLPLSLLLTLTKASETLSPGLPEADLMRWQGMLGGNVVMSVLMVGTQVAMYLAVEAQSFYASGDASHADYERTALCYVSSTQYVIVALALAHTHGGFRKPLYTNPSLIAGITVLLLANLVMTLIEIPWVQTAFDFVHLPDYFRWIIVMVMLVLTVTYVVIEQVVFTHKTPLHPDD